VKRRRGRRRKQLLNDLKEAEDAGTLKREALDPNLWRTGCGRGCGPAVETDHRIMSHVQQTENVTPLGIEIHFMSVQPVVYPSKITEIYCH
jgi:hypothetical protein